MANRSGPGPTRQPSTVMSRFEELTDLIYFQIAQGSDVLLDISDCVILLEGVDRLRERIDKKFRPEQRRTQKAIDFDRAMALLRLVAKDHDTTVDEIWHGRRTRRLVKARHDAIRRIERECAALSTLDIGRVMKVHHTSVLFALGTRKTDGRLAKEIRDAA